MEETPKFFVIPPQKKKGGEVAVVSLLPTALEAREERAAYEEANRRFLVGFLVEVKKVI